MICAEYASRRNMPAGGGYNAANKPAGLECTGVRFRYEFSPLDSGGRVAFSAQASRERGTVVLCIGRLHLPALRRQASPRRHGIPRVGGQCAVWSSIRAVEMVETSLQYLGVAASPWQIAFVCPVSKAATTASMPPAAPPRRLFSGWPCNMFHSAPHACVATIA